ncbi:DUF1059 domain-containing protein [Marisediminicola senii]|uniref:DUF1059 domain-containing protein n=1 Tax=Marisediminicola senii TaxID=2711233 RepID=UPI001F3DD43C|nr:DUF1059 domain-containing protein [Marisediminicola senii]
MLSVWLTSAPQTVEVSFPNRGRHRILGRTGSRHRLPAVGPINGGIEVKSFACGDVVPGCEATWVCSTEDEMLALVASHANTVHGIETLTGDLNRQIADRIVAVS